MTRPKPSEADRGHVVWPATCFYWSEIDASALGARPARRELRYLLESDLPLPLEDVHPVFAPLADAPGAAGGGRRVLACAVEHERLRTELPEDAVSLRPADVPEFLAGRLDCAALNLLVGRWEPARVRRLRRTWMVCAIVLAALCLGSVSWGIQRRTAFERDGALAAERLRRDVLSAAIGPAGALPNADMVLASELSRLRATRQAPPGAGGDDERSIDAATILADVLRVWPTDVHLRTESVAASGEGVSIAGSVPTSADAQKVADALARLGAGARGDGAWRIDQPRFETRRDGVSVAIRIRREEDRR